MASYERRKWPGDPAGFTRSQRVGGTYQAYLPDRLGARHFDLPDDVLVALEEASLELGRLESTARALRASEALARLLLRAESVGSSRLEGLVVSPRRLLRAELAAEEGERGDSITGEVAANVAAMSWAVEHAKPGRRLTVNDLLLTHRKLLGNTHAKAHAGRIRKAQNWIGGDTPVRASFVPPPPELVADLLVDLMTFVNDGQLPVLAKAAIAHAQFETIHPFADGNGRTGRALIHMVMRAQGVIVRVTPPISLALAARTADYVDALTAFRYVGPARKARGAATPWVRLFAAACVSATARAQRFEATVERLQQEWETRLGPTRADATALMLIRLLPGAPVLTATSAARLTGRSYQSVNEGLDRLVAAGVLRKFTAGARNRAFEAPELIDAFTAL